MQPLGLVPRPSKMTGDLGSSCLRVDQQALNSSNLQGIIAAIQQLPISNAGVAVLQIPIKQLGSGIDPPSVQRALVVPTQIQAQVSQGHLAEQLAQASCANLQEGPGTSPINPQVPLLLLAQQQQQIQSMTTAPPVRRVLQPTNYEQIRSRTRPQNVPKLAVDPVSQPPQSTLVPKLPQNILKLTAAPVSQPSQTTLFPKLPPTENLVQCAQMPKASVKTEGPQLAETKKMPTKREEAPVYKLLHKKLHQPGRKSLGPIKRPVKGCMGLVRTKKRGGIRPVKILRDFGGYWQVQYYQCSNASEKRERRKWEKLEWSPAWSEPKAGSLSTEKHPIGAILSKSTVAHFFAELTPQQGIPLEIIRKLQRLGFLS